MRHHAFSAAVGLVVAAAFVPLSATEAAAADPTGYWRKADQGERPGKMEIFRCGSGKRYICAKIVWLQNPLDSKGNPLRDVRNENPSQRGRPIMGLPIINGMAPVGANQWKGNIYNPEDGNTYSATLTLVSRNQINLRGCKGWILCGERTWLRTTLPKEEPAPEPEEQIEAKAEPKAEPEAAPATETAAAEPETAPEAPAQTEMLTPVAAPATQPGYRFLNGSTVTENHAGFSGENVPSMFAMTKPMETDAEETNGVAATETAAPAPQPAPQAQPAPAAQPKPKPQTIQANAAPAPSPKPQAAPRAEPAPAPVADGEVGTEPVDATETETAEAVVDPSNLSRRERRLLRRQQRTMQQEGQGLLPWLR
jgi:uncharacterized protein (DUF2147 family)